ncbi:LOB domain-containing protein 18 [Cajanus cajan]|nr:LOB domain-containing protein 18 [Cajanus cajan]
MSIARKKQKMELECGRKVSRGEIWIATHKHANGEFVNDEAKEIGEKIESYELSGSISKDISSQDSLAQTLGSQEHCGRVRGLGLGPCPSRVFGHTVRSYSGISSFSPSCRELQNELEKKPYAILPNLFSSANLNLLNELNAAQREDTVKSLAYEAEARLWDPMYGCVGLISILQHRLKQLQTELNHAKSELASDIGPHALLPPTPSPPPPPPPKP